MMSSTTSKVVRGFRSTTKARNRSSEGHPLRPVNVLRTVQSLSHMPATTAGDVPIAGSLRQNLYQENRLHCYMMLMAFRVTVGQPRQPPHRGRTLRSDRSDSPKRNPAQRPRFARPRFGEGGQERAASWALVVRRR